MTEDEVAEIIEDHSVPIKERADRALNWILAIVAFLAAGSVIMLILYGPVIFESRNNTGELPDIKSQVELIRDDIRGAHEVTNGTLKDIEDRLDGISERLKEKGV